MTERNPLQQIYFAELKSAVTDGVVLALTVTAIDICKNIGLLPMNFPDPGYLPLAMTPSIMLKVYSTTSDLDMSAALSTAMVSIYGVTNMGLRFSLQAAGMPFDYLYPQEDDQQCMGSGGSW
jgi:hypothetical protein